MSKRIKKSNNVRRGKRRLFGGISAALAIVCLVSSVCLSAGAASSDDYSGEIDIKAVSPTDSSNVISVSVSPSDADVISPTDLDDFAISSKQEDVGKNLTVQLTANRENVTWKSSNKKIATVDQDGNVKGIKVGTCIVSAEDEKGNICECKINVKKVCYLTFDDGPNQYTTKILNVLKKHDATATFFVVYNKNYLDVVKKIDDQGSLVAMHTYSHTYKSCYKSYYSYYQGLEMLSAQIKKRIGKEPNIIRFPGGSNNSVSDSLTMRRIISGSGDFGYKVFDWTASSGDASGTPSAAKSIKEVKKTCKDDIEVVLFHDKSFNASALETILPYLKNQGYIFETLDKCPEQYTFKPRYNKTASAKSVAIKGESVSVYQGKTVQLTATMQPSNSTDYIRWSSSDTSVAQVGIDGTVKGIKKGVAEIKATTSSGKTDTCVVKVKVSAKSLSLDKNVHYLKVNEQYALSAQLSPADAEETVKWTTSNRNIAKVDANGKVKAVKRGTVKITATATNGLKSTCTIHVINPTTSVQIKNAGNLYLGKSRNLTAELSRNAYDPITWTSDNPSVVSVSSKGKIVALSQGSATITATSYSGKSDSVKIYVRTKATKVNLDVKSKKVLLNESFTLNFNIVKPANCNDSVKWKVSNSKGLSMTVSADGRSAKIVGKRKGTYTVSVTTGSGKYASCRVTVVTPTQSLKINKTTSSLYVGKKLYLRANPTTKGSNDYVVSWSSSDASVARVNSNGVVTAVSQGTATITATSFSGKQVSCKVVVRSKAKSISLSQKSLTAKKGDVIVLNGSITSPKNCNDTVKWLTSSKSRAVILSSDENSAEIKIVGKGTVYITYKTGGGKYVKCRINCK